MARRDRPWRRALAGLLLAAAFAAGAQASEPQCRLEPYGLRMGGDMGKLRASLAGRSEIRIVAIGSSSTAGAGATAPDRAYPAQLERYLARQWPQRQVRVLNRGINGEEAADMIRRFGDDILKVSPDLVIWQVGTNYLMRNEGVGAYAETLREGLERLKRQGIGVILMDPQYAPRVLSDPDHQAIVDLIADVAREHDVPVFPRFSLMQAWSVQGIFWSQMLTPDMLHLNDWSYGCIAAALGEELAGPNSK